MRSSSSSASGSGLVALVEGPSVEEGSEPLALAASAFLACCLVFARRFWNQTWRERGVRKDWWTRRWRGERGEGRVGGQRGGGRGSKYLNTAGGHVELRGELLAERRVGLCVILVYALEDLELGAGGALAVLDLVRGVGIKSAYVDLGGVHAGGDESGDTGLVLGLVVQIVVGVEVEARVVGSGDGEGMVVNSVLGDTVREEVVESGLLIALVERKIVGWVVVEAGIGKHL